MTGVMMEVDTKCYLQAVLALHSHMEPLKCNAKIVQSNINNQ